MQPIHADVHAVIAAGLRASRELMPDGGLTEDELLTLWARWGPRNADTSVVRPAVEELKPIDTRTFGPKVEALARRGR